MTPLPRKVGFITLMRRLSSDGVSESFLGILDEPAGKQVIARRVLPQVQTDDKRAKALGLRMQDLLAVRHPFLVPALDKIEAEGDTYLIEDEVEAITLRQIIDWCAAQNCRVPPNVYLNLATQICNDLEALHGRPGRATEADNVLHLALRPDAVLVTAEGKVLVGRYGLTSLPTTLSDPTVSMAGEEGLEYLSPEQTYPDRDLSPASDVFSLGAVLYEFLTGERLFDATGSYQIIHQVRKAEITTQLLRVKGMMPGLDKVLYRALSLNPRHRYQRAFVLREDLRGLMAGFSFTSIAETTRDFLEPLFESALDEEAPTSIEDPPAAAPPPVEESTATLLASSLGLDDISEEAPPPRAPAPVEEDDHDPLSILSMPQGDGGDSTAAFLRRVQAEAAGKNAPPAQEDPVAMARRLAAEAKARFQTLYDEDADQDTDLDGPPLVEVSHSYQDEQTDPVREAPAPPPEPEVGDQQAALEAARLESEAAAKAREEEAEQRLAEEQAQKLAEARRLEDEAREAAERARKVEDAKRLAAEAAARVKAEEDKRAAQAAELARVRQEAIDRAASKGANATLLPPEEGGATLPPLGELSVSDAETDMESPRQDDETDLVDNVPPPMVDDDDDFDLAPKKSKAPLLIGGVIAVALAAGALLVCGGGGLLLSQGSPPATELAAVEPEAGEVAEAIAPATEPEAEAEAVPEAAAPAVADAEPEAAPAPRAPTTRSSSSAGTRSSGSSSSTSSAPSRSSSSAGTRSSSSGSTSSSRSEPSASSSRASSSRRSSSASFAAAPVDLSPPEPEDDGDLFAELEDEAPPELAALSEDAYNGKLSMMKVGELESTPREDPDFSRAYTLLYQNAKAQGDTRDQKSYLKTLMSLPENAYNPQLLTEQASMAIEAEDWDQALAKATLAERHWARLPSEILFSRKAMIYEVQAMAHYGRFRDSSGEDLTALTDSIRAWEKYQVHVRSKPRRDLEEKADEWLVKLHDQKRRLE